MRVGPTETERVAERRTTPKNRGRIDGLKARAETKTMNVPRIATRQRQGGNEQAGK